MSDAPAARHVRTSAADGVLHVTLDRPEVLNSFNAAMAAELRTALERAGADDAVRAVVLTGAGRAFCAGQDLAQVRRRTWATSCATATTRSCGRCAHSRSRWSRR